MNRFTVVRFVLLLPNIVGCGHFPHTTQSLASLESTDSVCFLLMR